MSSTHLRLSLRGRELINVQELIFFFSHFLSAAGAGPADARHHRVLLPPAAGGRAAPAALRPLHRGHVRQGADGDHQTVRPGGEEGYFLWQEG